jgi:hypothetical protein
METTTIQSGTSEGITSSTASCDINIPNYDTLRQNNLQKINAYYDKLLSSYTSAYNEYATQSRGTKNDQMYANTKLLPKYTNYNTQLINLSKQMINNVNQDMDLITAQKDELLEKTRQIDDIMENINLLKGKDAEMTVLTGARNQSLSSTNDGLDQLNFSNYIFVGVNVLCLLVVLGLVIYIVYSSFGTSNTSNTGNNVYKNISGNRMI